MQINIAGRQQPAATGRHSQRTGLRPQIDRAIGRVNRRTRTIGRRDRARTSGSANHHCTASLGDSTGRGNVLVEIES